MSSTVEMGTSVSDRGGGRCLGQSAALHGHGHGRAVIARCREQGFKRARCGRLQCGQHFRSRDACPSAWTVSNLNRVRRRPYRARRGARRAVADARQPPRQCRRAGGEYRPRVSGVDMTGGYEMNMMSPELMSPELNPPGLNLSLHIKIILYNNWWIECHSVIAGPPSC